MSEKPVDKQQLEANSEESNIKKLEELGLTEPKPKNQGWDESRVIVLLIGLSLMIEGILIYYQAGESQILVATITSIAGVLMGLIAYFTPFEVEEVEEEADEDEAEEDLKPASKPAIEADADTEPATEEKPGEPAEEPSTITEAEPEAEPEPEEELPWLERLNRGLTKTRTGFVAKLKKLVLGSTKIDEDLLDDLEETLYEADIGVKTTEELLNFLKTRVEEDEVKDPNAIYELLRENLKERLDKYAQEPKFNENGLTVFLIIGVNGVGKTTTIAKLANYYKGMGKSVVLAAGDTFRAAAIDQLCIWGERAKVDVIHGNEGGDPGALVFDAIHAAKKRKADLLLIDTAGRMHVKANLMSELKKIEKIAEKESNGGPHEILLVLDATTGQNAVMQAKQFNEAIPISGLVVTKLDGTAKGGVLFAVEEQISAPVKFIGVGEKMNDLMPFDPKEYLEALFTDDSEKKKESDYEVVK
jgi:fused signal recognition particle receptor